jgi:MATE family multidrug resistance protein
MAPTAPDQSRRRDFFLDRSPSMSFAQPAVARAGTPRFGQRARALSRPFSGSEARALIRLAGPIALIALVNMGMSVTDTLMVSWFFGTAALAAVAVGSDFYSIVFYLGAGVIAGLSPFVAAAVARQSAAETGTYRQAGWIVTGATAAALFPLVWFAPDLLRMAGLDAHILEAGRGYTRAMALTLVPMLVVTLFRTLLTAAERPKVFLWVTLAALPLNAAANAVFMMGFAGLPGLGPTGAGISSLAVATFMALALFVILARENRAARQRRAAIEWRAVVEVVRVGVPIGIATVADLGVFLGATLYAATLSAADVAAHTITLRLAGVFYAVPLALMQASTVRMARVETGEGDGRRVVIATGVTIGLVAGLLLAGTLTALAPFIADFAFDRSEIGVAAAGLTFGLVILLGVTELCEAPSATAAGLLRGVKDTRLPMIYVLFGYWVISAPLGLFLSRWLAMGITGVWIALALGVATTAILNLIRLRHYWR